MRHTRLSAVTFLSAAFFSLVLIFSGSAAADSMNFIGPGGNNSGGVYTYPYNFSINGGPSTPLICDTFDNDVTPGETWTATESSIPSGTGLFGATSSLQYKAAGIIFDTILGVNGVALSGTVANSSDANWAIWALFSSTARNSAYFTGDVNANNIYNAALAAAQNATNSDFAGLVLYVPNATGQTLNGQPWGNTPQEYIGYVAVPDAGEMSLIGTVGLLMLAGFASRKRLGLHCVVGNAR